MIIAMNSQTIQDNIESWAIAKNFNAPYGVLTGIHTSKNGTKYKSVTFGRARSLDATVEIYNRNFIIVRTSRHGSQVFKKYEDLSQFLETL
jgi:hypothetical protein